MKKHNAEILLGLWCCSKNKNIAYHCPNCPYYGDLHCRYKIISDAYNMLTNLLEVIEKMNNEKEGTK